MFEMSNSTTPNAQTVLPVDPGWLEKLIQSEYGTSAGIKSYRCQDVGEKKGYVSTVSRVDLEYSYPADDETSGLRENSKNAKNQPPPPPPDSLAIKVPSPDKLRNHTTQIPALSAFFSPEMVQRVHNREVKVYQHFQNERRQGRLLPIPIPRCLIAQEMDLPNNETGLIILEYVNGSSISFNDDYTCEQIEELARHIARLHAYSIANTAVTYSLGALDYAFWGPSEKLARNSLPKVAENFPDIFKGVTMEQINRASERLDRLRYKLHCPDKLGYHPVIAFGDSQPNNILFRPDPGTGQPGAKVGAFLDFQYLHAGPRVYDFCVIAFWGLPSQDFGARVDKMLHTYYSTLTSLVREGQIRLSFEQLKQEFHEFHPILLSIYMTWFSDPEMLRNNAGLTQERLNELVKRLLPIVQFD